MKRVVAALTGKVAAVGKDMDKDTRTMDAVAGAGAPSFEDVESFSVADIEWIYAELMVPSFPVRDELDPLESWLEMDVTDSTGWRNARHARRFFAVRPVDGGPDAPKFAGIAVVETFHEDAAKAPPREATALLAYIVVHPKFRGCKLSTRLVRRIRKDHPLLFLETETIPAEEGEEKTTRVNRMNVHKRNGFAAVDGFHYIQPPCSPDQGPCDDLTLMVYREAPDVATVPSSAVRSYVEAMCEEYDSIGSPFHVEMVSQTDKVREFHLS